jgi:hypothetical protein
MQSLQEFVRAEQIADRPVKLRSLLSAHKARTLSLRALFASREMLLKYVKVGREDGPLGLITAGVLQQGSRSFRIDTQLGFLDHDPTHVQANIEYLTAVKLAGVHCIGTEDPFGEDETYGFVSLYSILPGKEHAVITKRLDVKENVKAGNVIFKNVEIGEVHLISGSTGLKIRTSLWDEEIAGPPEGAEEKVNDAIQKGLLLVGSAAGAASAVPNPVTPIIAGVAAGIGAAMEVEWVRDGVGFLTGWLTSALEDDKIGEQEFTVNAGQLLKFSTREGYNSSLKHLPHLGADAPFNIPEDPDNPQWLFSEGGSTYKVYFNVMAKKIEPYNLEDLIP